MTTTTLLITVLSALLLGVYTAYWSIRGILYAFGGRRTLAPAKSPAKVVPFPASVNARS
ncbi:MAG TPA: hypothetical protein VFZ99_02640 [Terriglobales bacterium]